MSLSQLIDGEFTDSENSSSYRFEPPLLINALKTAIFFE